MPRLKEIITRIRYRGSVVQPPPEDRLEQLLYGVAQPLLAVRLLRAHVELRKAAFYPSALLAGFCALVAMRRSASFFVGFYQTFAALAVVPSVLFADHYSRMAARVRPLLGFGDAAPRPLSLAFSLARAVRQAILVALVPLPLVLGCHFLEILAEEFFADLAVTLTVCWSVHWILVDGLDNARTMRSLPYASDDPWFCRLLVRFHLTRRGGWVTRFSRQWHEELALLEHQWPVMLGMGAAMLVLMGIPILGALFRPVLLIAAAHLLCHTEARSDGIGSSIRVAEQAGHAGRDNATQVEEEASR